MTWLQFVYVSQFPIFPYFPHKIERGHLTHQIYTSSQRNSIPPLINLVAHSHYIPISSHQLLPFTYVWKNLQWSISLPLIHPWDVGEKLEHTEETQVKHKRRHALNLGQWTCEAAIVLAAPLYQLNV